MIDSKPSVNVKNIDNPAKKILAKYEHAKTLKDQWVSVFEECYEYALPQRESFFNETAGRRRTDNIFDETAVVGVQEFASRLQSGIVPNYARWAEFVAGTEIPEDMQKETNLALDEVTEYVFEILQNSNFSQEVHETFLDIALGTGVLLVEEGDAVQPIRFKAIPLPQVCLTSGYDDKVDAVYRTRKMRLKELTFAYAKPIYNDKMAMDMEANPDKEITIIESVYRDYSQTKEEVNIFCAIAKDYEHKIYEEEYRGAGSNPYITYRWSKCSGETYGRGPLQFALPAIKTANLVVELILENAQMSISGMYQVEDDGVINVDNIALIPGTVIPKAAGSAGLQPIAQAGSFNVSDLVLRDMRTNIKKALYNDMLGNPNEKTPMSATEVAERQADLSRQIGAAFGRLQAEMVNPVLARVIHILKKQGRIEIPTVNGKEVQVKSSSPLAQAQYQSDVVNIDRFLGLIQGRVGPQLLNAMIKQDEVAKYIAKKLGIPEELIRSPQEIAQMMQQMQQLQQMQQAAQGTPAEGIMDG